MRLRTAVLAGLAAALAVVVLLAPWASSAPDGLERVAEDQGFATVADEHALAGGPLAGYGVDGLEDPRAGTAASGAVGVAVTFGLATGAVALARRGRRRGTRPTASRAG